MNLQKKLLLVTIVPLLAVFMIIVYLTEVRVKAGFEKTAYEYTDLVAQDAAEAIESNILETVLAVDFFRSSVESLYSEKSVTRDNLHALLRSYSEDISAFAIGVHLEKDVVGSDADYAGIEPYDETGRFYFYIYKGGNGRSVLTTLPYDESAKLWYDEAKNLRRTTITEPFVYTIEENGQKKEFLIVSISSPIIVNGKFLGVVVSDVAMDSFQAQVAKISPYGTGFAHVISSEDVIIASRNPAMINTSLINGNLLSKEKAQEVVKSIKEDKEASIFWKDSVSKNDMYSHVVPVHVAGKNWGVLVSVSKNSAFKAVGMPQILLFSRITLGFILFVIVGVAFFVRKFIIKYLNQFVDALRNMTEGDGDLTKTIDIKTGDEFELMAGYLNAFTTNIRDIITNLKKTAESSINMSHEMSSASAQLDATFSLQAAEVSSVAAAMEEMAASAKEVEDVISENNHVVLDSVQKIEKGRDSLQKVLEAINNIKDSTTVMSDTVGELSESSEKIGTILNVINDVADQTNLLALNAAIEAARAGEAGRGFAVVADEVRKLAERTQGATSEIHSLISELQSGTVKAAEGTAVADSNVEDGVALTMDAFEVFKEIVSSVNTIKANSEHIEQAIHQQVDAIEGVNASAHSMSSSITQSSAAVSEFSQTAAQLSSESSHTGDLLKQFVVE